MHLILIRSACLFKSLNFKRSWWLSFHGLGGCVGGGAGRFICDYCCWCNCNLYSSFKKVIYIDMHRVEIHHTCVGEPQNDPQKVQANLIQKSLDIEACHNIVSYIKANKVTKIFKNLPRNFFHKTLQYGHHWIPLDPRNQNRTFWADLGPQGPRGLAEVT